MADHASNLVCALVGKQLPATETLGLIEAARALGVDPIDHLGHRLGLSPATLMARAADWLQVPFAVQIACDGPPQDDPATLAQMAGQRTLRCRRGGRTVLYAAPTFAGVLDLHHALSDAPELRDTLSLVPIAVLRQELSRREGERLGHFARNQLARRWPNASAQSELTLLARLVFLAGLFAVALLVAISPFVTQPLLLPLVALLLIAPTLLRLAALLMPALPERRAPLLPDDELPVYSVLIPLRDEAAMVPLLREAMLALDYPREKLDIKFVVEARSTATLAAVEALAPLGFETVVVPDSRPRTKPKALNFALPLVRGEHVVVYDAEDIPDPGQLRRAASEFAAHLDLDCLQAELVIDNAEETWLTALFAGEYAGQFGVLLPALARWNLPMPLGGTSNHFRVEALREAGAWDAYNVTEDADLGVRLARLRYRTATLASATREEAPIALSAWLKQRTRWTKGWMLTFIVHNRHPGALLRDLGWRGFLAFEVYVGSLIVSALLHTIFLATSALRLALGIALFGTEGPWPILFTLVLVGGYGTAMTIVVIGLLRIKRQRLLLMQCLLPFYWVLHAAAVLRASHELLTRPFVWAKTTHGRTRVARNTAPASVGAITFNDQ